MSDYVDFSALGQVLGASLLLGAGLVTIFAVGLVGLSMHEGAMASGEHAGGRRAGGGSAAGLALAALCFAVVVAGVLLGLWTVLNK